VIPLIIALPVDAKSARHISVKTASSVPTNASVLSGKATKKAHIKLVFGKHVLGKTSANSLGKFKIRLKHRLSVNKKYYLVASKKGYKQRKILISSYKVENNKKSKSRTPNNNLKNSRIQLIILSFSIKFSVNLLILSWACDYNLTNFTHHYHHILIFPTLYRVSLCIYLLALFCRRTRYNKKKMLLNFFFLLFLLCFHFILNKNYLLLLYNVFL